MPGGAGDDDPARDPSRTQVFDPVEAGLGAQVRVPIDGGVDPGSLTGTALGTGAENLALTPYRERYPTYVARALEAVDRAQIPARYADLVRDYFTEIEP